MKEREASETIIDMRHQTIEDIVAIHIPKNAYPEQWDVVGLRDKIKTILTLDLPIEEWASQEGVAEEEIIIKIKDEVDKEMIEAETEELINKIKTEGFESTAKIFSISKSAVNGGDLGWIKEDSISGEIKNILINTQVGNISESISLPEGILIFKVRNGTFFI